MFNTANTTHYYFDVQGITNSHKLQVLSFDGIEAINSSFIFEVTLVSNHLRYDITQLLSKNAFLSFTPDKNNGVHGVIHSVKRGAVGKDYSLFKVIIAPRFYHLNNETQQRAFIDKSVIEIISTLLVEHGYQQGIDFEFKLKEDYPKREFCCQYNESTAHFIYRLCQEEGINLHYQHTLNNHLMVFSDNNNFFTSYANSFQYCNDTGLVADYPVFKRFDINLSSATTTASYRNYNFHNMKIPEGSAQGTQNKKANNAIEPNLEFYDYPQKHLNQVRGEHYAKIEIERLRANHILAEANTDITTLHSGYCFTVDNYPALDSLDTGDKWLITQIYHQARQPQVLEALGSEASAIMQEPALLFKYYTYPINEALYFPFDGFKQGYRNFLVSIPHAVPIRPQRLHPKPKVLGTQTAIVTGATGEEIYCNQYGQIKILFHWDRINPANENSSHWVRVASNWAGDGYGAVIIPRVGMEVKVDFLEGDIDNPIVMGALHNGINKVPYELPANKTRSVFKTSSSKGGIGSNELRIEDKTGQEQIFLQAQKDFDQLTKNNHTVQINNNSHLQVQNEHSETIKGNRYTKNLAEEHHLTELDRKTQLLKNDYLTVDQEQHTTIGTILITEAGQEITLTAGQQIIIDGGLSLSLKAGGQHIVLNPSGIFSTPINPDAPETTRPREGCPTGMCPASPTVGNPVNPILGCKILPPEPDLILSAPEPFIFNRSYNSHNSHIGCMGQGWTTTGQSTALQVDNYNITIIDSYGRGIEFSSLGYGQSHYSDSEHIYLQRGGLTDNDLIQAGNYWHDVIAKDLLTNHDNYFIFQGNNCLVFSLIDHYYRLTHTINKYGYTTRYYWRDNVINTIQDSAGRYYALTYTTYPAINETDNGQRLKAIGLIDTAHYQDNNNVINNPFTVDSPAIDWLVSYEYSSQGDLINVNNKLGHTIRCFEYQDHILIAHGQPNGQYNRYSYDDYSPQGKVTEQHQQDGLSYQYTYKADHTEVTDSLGRTERYYFTGTGSEQHWTALERADGSVISFEYNELGQPIATIDPLGRKTASTLNAQGKLTAITLADGAIWHYTLDNTIGEPIKITDPEGNITTISYNDKGNIQTVTNPLGATTTYAYEDSKQPDKPTQIIQANGAITKFTWHSNGQLASYTDCSNFTTTKQYNNIGLLIVETNPKGETTTYHYNAINQLIKVILANGSQVTYDYDLLGRVIKITNPNQQITTFSYNRFGQVIKTTNPQGLTKYFNYDQANRITELTNENGATTTFKYDQLNRLIEQVNVDQSTQQKHYNLADELISQTDSNGLINKYNYDIMGRLIERITPATANTPSLIDRFTWFKNGWLKQAKNNHSTINYQYNQAGQLINETQQQAQWTHEINQTYDLLGNPEQTQYNHNPAIKWLRYGSGHIHSIAIQQTQLNFKRDELHREIERQLFINDQQQALFKANLAYNPIGLLIEQNTQTPNQQNWLRQYQYDPLGQLTKIQDSLLPTISYQYDNLGRLITSHHAQQRNNYYYDPANNRCSEQQLTYTTLEKDFTQGTPDPLLMDFSQPTETTNNVITNPVWLDNRITELNGQQYHYDKVGNITTIKQGNRLLKLSFDSANRLSKVQRYHNNTLELTANYQYDCFSRRISKTIQQHNQITTTYYGWQGDHLTTEQTNNQQTTIVYQPNSFTPLLKMEQNTHNLKQPIQLAFYQVDHLGTPLRVINELSNIIWQAEADDWRAVKNAQGIQQPIRYQGQYEDQETGLYYNRYRYYAPDLGRYISHDPIGLAGGFNTYNYPTNPNNKIDPLGLDVQDAVTIINTILESITEMTAKGLRIPPTPIININNTIPGTLDCGGQTEYTITKLDKLKNALNDNWEFNLHSGFGHAWGIARSSNPNDPIIWFDPRAGVYSTQSPCPTCHGMLGTSIDKTMGFIVDPYPAPNKLPKGSR